GQTVSEVHRQLAARSVSSIRSERFAVLVQLAFADGYDASVQPSENAIDVVQQSLQSQRLFRQIDQMWGIVGVAARPTGRRHQPACVAAKHLDELDLSRQGTIIGADIAHRVREESRGSRKSW